MIRKSIIAAISLFFAATTAHAADVGVPIPVKATAPAAPNCTVTGCSGWYIGGNIIGTGSNLDIIGSGINGSVFSGGGALGLDAGYQFWNGQFFFAGEVFGDYDVLSHGVGSGNQNSYLFGQVAKFGIGLSGLFGGAGGASTTPSQSPVPITVPAQLASSLISPYVQFGAVERPWGVGWATGAGADFVIAAGWNLDISYLYVQYNNASINPITTEQNENLIKLSLNRKF